MKIIWSRPNILFNFLIHEKIVIYNQVHQCIIIPDISFKNFKDSRSFYCDLMFIIVLFWKQMKKIWLWYVYDLLCKTINNNRHWKKLSPWLHPCIIYKSYTPNRKTISDEKTYKRKKVKKNKDLEIHSLLMLLLKWLCGIVVFYCVSENFSKTYNSPAFF